ncbi:hypothetical protein QYF36_000867 [Acer negundo]|nr:hypothetical protein QYF36_000867 [Acer negundo]
MTPDDVTEGVQDEEESRDDDSVKTDRGDNVMSLYSGDEKQSKSKKGKEVINTSDASEGNNSRSPKQKKKKDNLHSVAPKDILEQAVHNKKRKPTVNGDQANKKAKEETKPIGGK